ncbi:MAG: M23 family metallopeptidase [Deltaproteobacteria bacterium]|nr:MAG: M23 family metallopeptidase [Deltaproteobacteria bacterium]
MFRWLLMALVPVLILPGAVVAFDLQVSPHRVRDGGAFLVHLAAPGLVSGHIRFLEREYPFEAASEEVRVLVPVPIDSHAGTTPLRLVYLDRQGRRHRIGTAVEVLPGDYPVERLTLPERMVSPRRPEVVERIRREQARLERLFAEVTPARFWQGVVAPVDDPVGSRFGRRRILNGKPRSPHGGVDFRSPRGRQVRSPAAGRVVLAGDLFFTGNTLVIDHGGGLFSILAHLQDSLVGEGSDVVAGQTVGTVGATGRATGPHLHWTLRLRRVKVDPLAVLALFNGGSP